MSQPQEVTAASEANDAEHSVAATKSLTKEIRDALDETQVGEDVWQDVDVNEPDNPQSSVVFTIEGTEGLYYAVTVTPKVD